jgi:hypothetical protein
MAQNNRSIRSKKRKLLRAKAKAMKAKAKARDDNYRVEDFSDHLASETQTVVFSELLPDGFRVTYYSNGGLFAEGPVTRNSNSRCSVNPVLL